MEKENNPTDQTTNETPQTPETENAAMPGYTRETINFKIPVYYTADGHVRTDPQDLPVRQAAGTMKKLAEGFGIDTDLNLLMCQLEQCLDLDYTGDATSADNVLALQMRRLDAVFGKIIDHAVGDGRSEIDQNTFNLALRTQRQCLMAFDSVNRRRNRVLQTERFNSIGMLKKRYPNVFKE